MKKELLIIAILIIGISPIFAEEKKYVLEIDEHVFNIVYDVDADVLAMAIDQESKSLLVGVENAQDSQFMIAFPKEMIDAENDAFAVLVNGVEIEYEISSDSQDYTLIFYVPVDSEEVEIIGTHVIPEFGSIVTMILAVSIISIIVLSAKFNNMRNVVS